MTSRTFVHVGAVLVCVFAVSLLAACDQPAPKCNVAHGSFWAQYTLVSGEGECAMLTGEELGVQSYYARRSADDKRPDYDNVSIALQPMTITAALWNAEGMAEPDPADVPYAIGRFGTKTPANDGFCVARKLAVARLRLPAVPEYELDMCTTAAAAPAYDVSYAFSNVRVYYTPSAIGTQLAADLTYTQAGCVAKYKVTAVYPMVSCGVPGPLEDAGLLDAAGDDAALSPPDAGELDPDAGASVDAGAPCPAPDPPTGPPVADDSLCENAGINPDFAVECDPAAMMCVLENKPPSLE
jgi:hypothetical protein